MIEKVSCTCGKPSSRASTFFMASLVRSTEAPSGSWIDMKKAPWSSSGRNPIGVFRDSAVDRRRRTRRLRRATNAARRTQERHAAAIAVARPVDAAAARVPSGRGDGPPGRSTSAQSAGDRVSAFKAEISMATLIVTANWRNNWPETPGMKAIGTNTDSSTSVIAMIGAVIWRHRLLGRVGRREVRLLLHHAFDVLDHDDRIVDDDADGQHEREQRDRVGGIADRQQHGERADQADRHRDRRNDRGAQAAEKQEHDDDDEDERLRQRLQHLVDGVA